MVRVWEYDKAPPDYQRLAPRPEDQDFVIEGYDKHEVEAVASALHICDWKVIPFDSSLDFVYLGFTCHA